MYEKIIEQWKKANPITCHRLGIHDFDGHLPDYSDEFISNRISVIKLNLLELKNLNKPMEKMELFEYGLIVSILERELFELEERKEFRLNPLYFISPLTLIEMSYTARNFAPIDDRIQLIIKFEKEIPSLLNRARELLEDSLAKSKIEMGIGYLKGIISYYKDKLIAFVTQTDDESLIDEWSVANIEAVEAMERFVHELQETYLPIAHENFALGEEKFLKLLEKTEGVNSTVEKLIEIGEADLNRNYNTMLEIGKNLKDKSLEQFLQEIRNDVPEPDKLVEEAESTLERTKQFLVKSGIVSIPTDKQTQVIPTPEYARGFAFAAMNTPGPFEVPEAAEAYYWITPPDLTWSEEKIKQFMSFFNRPFLEIVTVHEVWPGHYLQLLYNNQATSDIAKMFARSTSMIEGWGHYAEEMVYDAGYEPFDRVRLHVGQLIGALVRNVRYIAALKMHCQNMTVETAKQMFIEKAFLAEPNAQIEANRGSINPMYLNYTLGKLMILKLREDYKKERGNKFSLRKFHDELLSYGSPPITVLRKLMLTNPGASENIL